MNARLKQPLHTELFLAQQSHVRRIAARRLGWIIAAYGFCCLMPYVAIPVGNHSAIQIGNLLTLALVLPIALVSWKNQPFWIYPLLLAPLCLSMFIVSVTADDASLGFKAMVLWAFSMLAMLPTQLYAADYSLELLTGIAVAAILHMCIGVWQWKAFYAGYFPLESLFENQSFLSVKDNAETIAKYNQRPFGVFPEPSAMSASLAPWVLFWMAELFGLIRLKRTPATWQRILFGAAAAGALGLIILSRSGHAMITLAIVVMMSLVWFVRCRATLRNFLAIVSVCWIALPIVLVLAAIALSERMGGGKMGNSSWEDRSHSLLIGFKLLTETGPFTLLFGIGIGQTSPILQKDYGLEAIWSV